MSRRPDTLTSLERPDRLNYAEGVLLDSRDLEAEQRYHRGRLARSLAYLHGYGTAAGLKVSWEPTPQELRVAPGLAVDRLGRMIEVPDTVCLRLTRWLDAEVQSKSGDDALRLAVKGATLTLDLFLAFSLDERGRTQAFARPPYDTIDATVAARVRDHFGVLVVPRPEQEPPLPRDPWPRPDPGEPFGEWRERLNEALMAAWRHGTASFDHNNLPLPDGHVPGQDTTAVLLARVRAQVQLGGGRLALANPPSVQVDNHVRPFLYPASAWALWLPQEDAR